MAYTDLLLFGAPARTPECASPKCGLKRVVQQLALVKICHISISWEIST
jgi:hypothetical protein